MNTKTNWLKILLAPAFALGLSFAVVGCDDGDADDDTLGENVDEGINNTRDGMDELGEEAEDGMNNVGEGVEDLGDELDNDANDLLDD